jgi:sporulation protein YlmC with PRC-barrel domain
MSRPRYLPAGRAKAAGFRLGRLRVCASNGREIGKLLGFIIDTRTSKIYSMVVESDDATLELPMSSAQFDIIDRTLRLVEPDVHATTFQPESVPHVDVEDLWVPTFDTAA